MGISKSILNSAELDDGSEVYVQVSGSSDHVSLSFDGKTTSFVVNISQDDAQKIEDAINKTLEEANHGK